MGELKESKGRQQRVRAPVKNKFSGATARAEQQAEEYGNKAESIVSHMAADGECCKYRVGGK